MTDKPHMKIEPEEVVPQQPQTAPKVTDRDLMNIFALPAVYSDHFFAGNSSGFVRITFAEKTMGIEGNPAIPRSSVILTHHGLVQLSDLLNSIRTSLETQQAKSLEREKLN